MTTTPLPLVGPMGAPVWPDFIKTRSIQVGLASTGFCNARCSSCIWPFMTGPRGVMKLDEFRQVLHNLSGFEFSEFGFNVINEPFTDRGVCEKLRELVRQELKITTVFFSSNWLLPNEAMIADFVNAVATLQAAPNVRNIALNATISGINDASYDVLQAGSELTDTISPYRRLDFQRAVANICAVLRGLGQLKSGGKFVFRIKAYGHLFSEAEMHAFWTRALHEGGVPNDFVERNVKILLNHEFISFARAPGLDELGGPPQARRCSGRWTLDKIVVGPGGEVGLCCQDGLRDVLMGSLLHQHLREIVASDAFQMHHRIAMGLAEPDASHPCYRCEFYESEAAPG